MGDHAINLLSESYDIYSQTRCNLPSIPSRTPLGMLTMECFVREQSRAELWSQQWVPSVGQQQ
jgi:hypothetical protein